MTEIANKTNVKIEIKSPAAKFFDFMRYDMDKLSNLSPQVFKRTEVVEGTAGHVGCIILYESVIGTTVQVSKVKTTKIDEKERTINFDPCEGEGLKDYPNFKTKVIVSEGNVEWSVEYEKAHESIPCPDHYCKFFGEIIKLVDAHLLSRRD